MDDDGWAPCVPAPSTVPAEPHLVALGAAIRQARNDAGLSQEALAAETGVDRSYFGHVERGTKNLSVLMLGKIAAGVGVPAWELMRRAAERD